MCNAVWAIRPTTKSTDLWSNYACQLNNFKKPHQSIHTWHFHFILPLHIYEGWPYRMERHMLHSSHHLEPSYDDFHRDYTNHHHHSWTMIWLFGQCKSTGRSGGIIIWERDKVDSSTVRISEGDMHSDDVPFLSSFPFLWSPSTLIKSWWSFKNCILHFLRSLL